MGPKVFFNEFSCGRMPFFIFLIAPGFNVDSQKMELAIYLTRITFPFLFFISLSSFFSAILNSHNRFAIASAAPIILNILLLSVLFFGKILNDKLVIYFCCSSGFSFEFKLLSFSIGFPFAFHLLLISCDFRVVS